MRQFAAVALLLLSPMLIGWASIISGTSQMITVNSEPSGATVMSQGRVLGKTPLSVGLERKKGNSLLLKKEGYEDSQIYLGTKLNGYLFIGVVFGLSGFLSSSTDSSTGAATEYFPNSFYVTLSPKGQSSLEKKDIEDKMHTRNFILMNYHSLTADISRGEGEYLSNLYFKFGIAEKERPDALDQLKEMASRYENIPSFSEAVTNHFISKSHG